MEFLFILRYLSFLSVSVKRCEKISRGVDQSVAHSTYYVTQTAVLTRDIISNAPAYNTTNRCGVFAVYFITYNTGINLSLLQKVRKQGIRF